MEHDYEPESYLDAVNFFNGYYGLLPKASFVIQAPINDEVVDVLVDESYPFSAFIPEVWNMLTISQRMTAINMVKNYFVNRDQLNQSKKLRLSFISAYQDNTGASAYIATYDSHRMLYVNDKYLFLNTESSLELLANLFHELTHVSQRDKQERIVKQNITDAQTFSKLVIDSYSTLKILRNVLNEWQINNVIKVNKTVRGNLTDEDINTLLEMSKPNNQETSYLIQLLYASLPYEAGAENRASKLYSQVVKDFKDRYGYKARYYREEYYMQYARFLEHKYGYKLSKDDILNFGKVNALISNFDTLGEGLKVLAELYRNKQLTYTVNEKDYKSAVEETFKLH